MSELIGLNSDDDDAWGEQWPDYSCNEERKDMSPPEAAARKRAGEDALQRSNASSARQSGAQLAVVAVSLMHHQTQTGNWPVEMSWLCEAPARGASRKVKLVKGLCSDRMARASAHAACGDCSPTKRSSGASVTATLN